MAATVGDIIRFTVCQRYQDQQICNIFAYIIDAISGIFVGEDVTLSFEEFIIDAMNGIQAQALTNESVLYENLTNGIDFYERSVSGGGDVVEAGSPVFVAASFKLLRSSKVTRSGFKRIAGVAEGFELNPQAWDVTDTAFTTLAGVLGDEFVNARNGNTVTMSPIILGRNTDGTPDLDRYQVVANVVAQDTKTTQNSRKIGTGA